MNYSPLTLYSVSIVVVLTNILFGVSLSVLFIVLLLLDFLVII